MTSPQYQNRAPADRLTPYHGLTPSNRLTPWCPDSSKEGIEGAALSQVSGLRSTSLSILFRDSSTGREVSIAKLNESGHELATLSVLVPTERAVSFFAALERRGVRAHSAISFDEACAVIEALASRDRLHCSRRYPQLTSGDVREDAFHDLKTFSLESSRAEAQVDTLTGLPGKSVLLGERSLRELCAAIPGDKVIAFIDFNNMGLANKVGLGNQVDSFLSKMPAHVAAALSDTPHKLIRLGGDEFALVLSGDKERSYKTLEQFRSALNELRKNVFSENSQTISLLEKAEERAERRAAMRALLSRYKAEAQIGETDTQGKNPFQHKAFRAWIVDQLRRYEPTFLPSRIWTGTLVLQLTQHEQQAQSRKDALAVPARKPRVMTFSMGACEIGSDATPEQVSQALALGEKDIHIQKESGRAVFTICSRNELPSMRLRSADEETLLSQAISERQGISAHLHEKQEEILPHEDAGLIAHAEQMTSTTELLSLRAERARVAGLDPSVGYGVLRYNLVKDFPLKTLLITPPSQALSAFVLDVNHFGVLNNQLGYARADALIGALSNAIRTVFPEALICRKDGGKLVVISAMPVSASSLHALRQRAELALQECVNDRVLSEYQLRVAQELFDSGKRGLHLAEVGIRRVKLHATQQLNTDFDTYSGTVAQVISKIERSAIAVKRKVRP